MSVIYLTILPFRYITKMGIPTPLYLITIRDSFSHNS